MSWFRRVKEGILTSTQEKKGTPEGVWNKCPSCKNAVTKKELVENNYVCPGEECNYHFRIGSREYFSILFDNGKFEELFEDIKPTDPLKFKDNKPYKERLKSAQKKTHLSDAIRCGKGKLRKNEVMVACMDFSFIGGSMGSVVGEKIARSIDEARDKRIPLIIISKSGGARMMESAFSLMQMAKTSAKLALLDKEGVPYFSILTDPTTGGVTASFSMLGDFNIAEPNALIGFAGPRVIKQTIGKDLPEGFQSSEFLLEKGFLDFITDRRELKDKLSTLIQLVWTKDKIKRQGTKAKTDTKEKNTSNRNGSAKSKTSGRKKTTAKSRTKTKSKTTTTK